MHCARVMHCDPARRHMHRDLALEFVFDLSMVDRPPEVPPVDVMIEYRPLVRSRDNALRPVLGRHEPAWA